MDIALTRRFVSQLSLLRNLICAVDEEKLRRKKRCVTTVSVITSIPSHSPHIIHIMYLQ